MSHVSSLKSALRRIGMALSPIEGVIGEFSPLRVDSSQAMLIGLFSTHDAKVEVRIRLDQYDNANDVRRLKITGRPWIDDSDGRVSILVKRCEPLEMENKE